MDGVMATLPSGELSGQNQQAVLVPVCKYWTEEGYCKTPERALPFLPYCTLERTGSCAEVYGFKIGQGEKAPTVTAAAGMSGNNQPVVCYNGENITSPQNKANPVPGDPCHTLGTDSRNYLVYCLQGNGIDRADTAGCNGKGVKEDVSYTLNTIDRPAVAYAMQGFGDYKDCGVVSGLKARDYKDATDLVVEGRRYIVRRLTPTECARLQGFPDDWGHPDHKESLTNDEYAFWMGVRNTHAAINGKAEKQYTREQMVKWYNGLHTDSAEYKMWGNGIALPPALYCMQGIAEALRQKQAEEI
jgi:DNA (cytosine-5)-methyltransferase 1